MNFPNITLPSSFFFLPFLKRNLLQFYRHHTPAGDLQISISSTNFSQHFKISTSHGSRYLQLSIFNINSSSSHIIKFSTLLKDRKNMNYSPPLVSVGGIGSRTHVDTKIHVCSSLIVGPPWPLVRHHIFNQPQIPYGVCNPQLVESVNVEPTDTEGLLYIFWKKSRYKCTCAFQTRVVQGSTVFVLSKQGPTWSRLLPLFFSAFPVLGNFQIPEQAVGHCGKNLKVIFSFHAL